LVSVLHRYIDFAVRDALDGFQTRPEYLDAPLPQAQLGQLWLAGKPDHIGIRRSGDRLDAIRIDDFKYSSASSFTAKQLKQSFQIPVYAYLAARALGAEPGVRMEGRYLLMRSPGHPVISQPIDEDVFDEVRQRIELLVEKVRDGRLEPEPLDKQDCTDCDYRRLCRLYGG
jgi:CRISPR/Cas system-associated exonuclease Cas4 (RecB family)